MSILLQVSGTTDSRLFFLTVKIEHRFGLNSCAATKREDRFYRANVSRGVRFQLVLKNAYDSPLNLLRTFAYSPTEI